MSAKNVSNKIQLTILSVLDCVVFPLEKRFFYTDDSVTAALIAKVGETSGSLIGVLYAGVIPLDSERIGTVCYLDKKSVEISENGNGQMICFSLTGRIRFRIKKVLNYMEVANIQYPSEAEIEVIPDENVSLFSLDENLVKRYNAIAAKINLADTALPSFEQSLKSGLSVGNLADKIAVSLGDRLSLAAKAGFLMNLNPRERFDQLVKILERFVPSGTNVPVKRESSAGHKNKDVAALSERFEKIKNNFTEEGRNRVKEELYKLESMNADSSFYSVSLTYLDFVLSLFSLESTEENKNLGKIEDILDKDHYGLEKIKKRIIEYVAVKLLNPGQKSPILCFVGPPGVGKTSLGKSIAHSLNRKFCRWSVGGVSDEAEIRGHRSTYVGALPGRILQEIKNCGASNPLFMIDEIDKPGAKGGFRGDIESALLEVLDPEQNFSFSDNFVQIGFDLSRVLFIVTANIIETIPPALRDRMEILRLPGYAEDEKIQIAGKFLIPRQLKENGLTGKLALDFSETALARIIKEYTMESGVRELERKIADICRKLAVEIAKSKSQKSGRFTVHSEDVPRFLGPRKYFHEEVEELQPGVAIGLAWTETGGEILFIESIITNPEGGGELCLTGNIGQVMEESVKACISFLRSRIHSGRKKKSQNDIHIHVPQGAVSKDGPSAGVAILASLYSLFKGIPIKKRLALTGEITLRGKVEPVGGIKEKLIGAERAGIKEVIMPRKNQGELEDLSPSLKNKIASGELKIHLVDTMDEALDIAFPGRKIKTK